MSERLKALQTRLSKDPLDYLGVKSLIPQHYISILDRVEQFARNHLTTQQFFDHNQSAQFPHYLIPHLQELDIAKYFIPKPYGEELPLIVQGAIIATVAQFDLGVSTFLFLQLPLAGRTLFKLGSEEQKQKYLPDLIGLKTIWGWALTEREVGSNSTRLGTTYRKDEGGLVLNGNKRWIGNGNQDYLIVYGSLQESGKKSVVGGIVDMRLKGVTSIPIPNKYAFRIVQNCQIEFDNVRLPSSALLPGAVNYKQGVEKVLKHSRIIVIWNAIGGCLGVYKHALRYTSERQQFGRPIAGFQLVQEKLVRIMGNLQAVLLAGWRLTELYQSDGQLSTGKIGLFKAWVTERGRVICALGREVMGGNGLLRENFAMQALVDMQVLYTYEGTYDINSLVAGFELTGLKAFT